MTNEHPFKRLVVDINKTNAEAGFVNPKRPKINWTEEDVKIKVVGYPSSCEFEEEWQKDWTEDDVLDHILSPEGIWINGITREVFRVHKDGTLQRGYNKTRKTECRAGDNFIFMGEVFDERPRL